MERDQEQVLEEFREQNQEQDWDPAEDDKAGIFAQEASDETDGFSDELSGETDEDGEEAGRSGYRQSSASSKPGWFVVHTYSGYENKVKTNIEKTIENRHLEDQILEVRVPLQEVMELKNGKMQRVQRKLFPGYVLLNMVMNDDTWYVIRNTRGVTGFVGPASKPVPLTEEEMMSLFDTPVTVEADFGVGDWIVVVEGVWKGTEATILSIDNNNQLVTIGVDVLGRETPVEVSFTDVRKL